MVGLRSRMLGIFARRAPGRGLGLCSPGAGLGAFDRVGQRRDPGLHVRHFLGARGTGIGLDKRGQTLYRFGVAAFGALQRQGGHVFAIRLAKGVQAFFSIADGGADLLQFELLLARQRSVIV